jgi:hypothetical protein
MGVAHHRAFTRSSYKHLSKHRENCKFGQPTKAINIAKAVVLTGQAPDRQLSIYKIPLPWHTDVSTALQNMIQ